LLEYLNLQESNFGPTVQNKWKMSFWNNTTGRFKGEKIAQGLPLDIVASFSIRDRHPIMLLDI
jgi:hypothetical protein